jgi:hypothetical protein
MNIAPRATAAASNALVQQALFVLFAVLVTLLGCTAYQRLTEAPEPLLRNMQHAASAHFSPVSSHAMEASAARVLEPAAEVNAPAAPQQRWTF